MVLAGHLLDRTWVISCGCVLWAVMAVAFCGTHAVSASSLGLWAATGLGLALIIPNVQYTIAGELSAAISPKRLVQIQDSVGCQAVRLRVVQAASRMCTWAECS